MYKLVHLWQCLSDTQVIRLREEITSSQGIKKLVSEDDDYIERLICAEMTENITHVAKFVARVAKKCSDPGLKSFEIVFTELVQIGADPYGWRFSSKMDKKVEKMERLISVNATLYQEMELLADLEQTLRRMKSGDTEPENLLEFQKKVIWKQHGVKNLRESSLWKRTCDYTIRLLAKSIFTIFGPLGGSTTKSGSISGKNGNFNFHSGPLGRPTARLTQVGPFKGCMIAVDGATIRNCCVSSNGIHSGILNGTKDGNLNLLEGNAVQSSSSVFRSQCRLLDAPPETLGASALALHYANVVIVIEKLAASPHLIGHDARDDLYNLLPASVRAALRVRLKPYAKSLASSAYDTELVGEWTEATSAILEWLAPLAHNMIRWQSERSFEQQSFVSRTNVLLVQTLYVANREKTEAAITEILVGLNYVWRLGREFNAKALQECASSRIFDECLDLEK
ncbi:hypothetical protein CRYUN_Cryun09bG0078000 [Craigia yunnanensis]